MTKERKIRLREDLGNSMDMMQNDAQRFVGRNNSTPSRNPTAGGGTGREWADHKYIDKVKTKTGNIRYVYDIDTASGHQRSVSKDELKRVTTAMGTTNPRAILAKTQASAKSRNTGGSNQYHNFFKDTSEAIGKATYQARKAVGDAVASATKAVSDGVNFVSKMMSDAIANTPIKDLFK